MLKAKIKGCFFQSSQVIDTRNELLSYHYCLAMLLGYVFVEFRCTLLLKPDLTIKFVAKDYRIIYVSFRP